MSLIPAVQAALTGRPIAHRGLWRPGQCPENSLGAFQAACAAGYGVELDVRLTADGEAVVFHDDGLERLTVESGLVEERTAEELSTISLLGGDHQTIPSLAQALAMIGGRSLVLVELKTPAGQEGLLEARVAQLLEGYDGPAAVLSFNALALSWMAAHRPNIARGLNAATATDLHGSHEAKADFLSVCLDLAATDEVQAWRAQSRLAVAWTVRRADQRARLDGRVDNVMFEGFAP